MVRSTLSMKMWIANKLWPIQIQVTHLRTFLIFLLRSLRYQQQTESKKFNHWRGSNHIPYEQIDDDGSTYKQMSQSQSKIAIISRDYIRTQTIFYPVRSWNHAPSHDFAQIHELKELLRKELQMMLTFSILWFEKASRVHLEQKLVSRLKNAFPPRTDDSLQTAIQLDINNQN